MEKVDKIYWDERIFLFLKEATLCQKMWFDLLENFCERERHFTSSCLEVFCKKGVLKN